MFRAPSRNFVMTSNPKARESGVMPMALHTEYRPPTQFQNSNTLLLSMPKFAHLSGLVDNAMKCFATAFSSLTWFLSHVLHRFALSIVSSVVNVLLAIMKRVVS